MCNFSLYLEIAPVAFVKTYSFVGYILEELGQVVERCKEGFIGSDAGKRDGGCLFGRMGSEVTMR